MTVAESIKTDSASDSNANPCGVALVVEDEALVAQFLTGMLEDMGFRVIQAATATAGLHEARTSEPLTVAFVDLGLPDRSGLELIDELQQLKPRFPIVMSTGYAAMAQRDADGSSSPLTFLAKPYNMIAIARALGELGIHV